MLDPIGTVCSIELGSDTVILQYSFELTRHAAIGYVKGSIENRDKVYNAVHKQQYDKFQTHNQ